MLTFATPCINPQLGASRPQLRTTPRRLRTPTAKLSAVLFDCDGVLAESERDGHRAAFNAAFTTLGLPDHWDSARYGKLLSVGGGKERLTAHWNEVGWPPRRECDALVKEMHITKTALFARLVADGKVPLRMGIAPLINALLARDIIVAVCSTSQERAVRGVVGQLGDDVAAQIAVFAGDIVHKKKPAPDVYLLALEKLGLDGKQVCVVEDSAIGMQAAKAAGLPVLVTKSAYTQDEDFLGADRVVESIVDAGIGVADLEAIVDKSAARIASS